MIFTDTIFDDPPVDWRSAQGPLFDTKPSHAAPPEMWGGLESTVNRVGDHYFDQTIRSGHQERISDLELFADLGISAIRYPVLWERTAPDGLDSADWRWPDERLGALRRLGVRPIVGLVHHGSGPRDTNLLDPAFPERLAAYARAVAERYPWVEDWTPVNEPLTTARFSSLYGFWYPHKHDDLSFARTLLNECRAVVLAMEAIRSVNSAARLIQTDDLGKTFATPGLAYQAEWENERRWLTWDLLTGTLTPDRPLWAWMQRLGIPDADLRWFLEHPCPPDILGINHYLSSARFLDDRLERYPSEDVGTNGRHRYVDVLAARVLPHGAPGPGDFLLEAWQRYHLPVAVTEAHNGCTREEQVRWLDEVWRGAREARATGADVRAVTAWSLLGAFDWDHMVTQDQGHYEPGVFDLRTPDGQPRATALAHMVRDLANEGHHAHPVLAESGWWRQPDRFYHATVAGAWRRVERSRGGKQRPILIVGEESRLRYALRAACRQRYLAHHVIDGGDLSRPSAVDALLRAHEPWAVIDLRGLAGGRDMIRRSQPHGYGEKTVMADPLAARCAEHGVVYLAWSAGDQIQDAPRAVRDSNAAHSRRQGLGTNPDALVIRTEPRRIGGGPAAAQGAAVAPSDGSPLHGAMGEVVHAALDLLVDGERGIWRLPHAGPAENVGTHASAA